MIMKSGYNRRRFLAAVVSLSVLGTTAGLMPAMSAAALDPIFDTVGDVNMDGDVTVADAIALEHFLIRNLELNTQALVNADLNADKTINAFDLTALKRTLLAQPTNPPTEEAGIYLKGTTLTAVGEGITQTSETIATITMPGEYNIYGEMTGGQIVVDVDKTAYPDGEVTLGLNGITLSNESDSPIYIASLDGECAISVKKDTENVISDGTDYVNADDGKGAIYAKDDLKIKGKGKLTVNGNCKDGIVSKDGLKIWNSNLTVNAVDDCLRGKDSVKIGDKDDTDFSALNVTLNSSAGNGIKVTETEAGKGDFVLNGGTVKITAYGNGIHASQQIVINAGTLDITTTCPATTSGGGMFGGAASSTTAASAKGLKAGVTDDTTTTTIEGTININGGTVTINATDDSVHATNVNILAGNLTLASGDDGIHGDKAVNIGAAGATGDYTTPSINITKSYEGVEGTDIVMNSGALHIIASDDGFNAAGGNDGSGNQNPGGWAPGGMSSSSGTLTINGGYTFMQAKGDGLDANGPAYLNGGVTVVNGFTSGDTSPLDADQGVTYAGGTLLGYGASSMMVTPSAYSFLTTSAGLSAGTQLTFADSTGAVLSTVTVPAGSAGQYLVYCSPEKSVTCYTGGTVSGATMFDDAYGEGGTISGGTAMTASTGGGQNPWNPRG